MWSLRVTIYELLGYLAPGVVGLAALALFAWAAFFPQVPIALEPPSLTKEEIALLLFASYTVGHLMQGLSNILKTPEKLKEKSAKQDALVQAAKRSLKSRLNVNFGHLSVQEISSLATARLTDLKKTDIHDVYVYREGFYRGSMAGYILFGAALLFRSLRGATFISVHGAVHQVGLAPILYLLFLSLLTAFVFYKRYVRFGKYRLENLLASLSLPQGRAPEEDSGESAGAGPEETGGGDKELGEED